MQVTSKLPLSFFFKKSYLFEMSYPYILFLNRRWILINYSGSLNNEHPNNGNIWIAEHLINKLLLVRFSNGSLVFIPTFKFQSNNQMVINTWLNFVWYSNDIPILDLSAIRKLLTILILDQSGIQIPTFFEAYSFGYFDFLCNISDF